MTGPTLPFSDELHATKYRGKGEDFREAVSRFSTAMADNPEHYNSFRDIAKDMRFLPAGRVQSAMGSTKNVTAYNCFVSGTIEDSFIDGHGSIMGRASEAAATMRMGGGIGYDFSSLRPRGALIRKLQSRSSGPIAFMDIFDAVCKCVASSGHRRGAQMGILRIDHPDVEEFIHAKQNNDKLQGFNTSIAVTDEFMNCLENGLPFQLKWNGEVFKEINAAGLWEMIMRSTWDWAEPGVLFIDTINRMNNLYYCENIAATNPCVPAGTPILTKTGWQDIENCVGQKIEVWNGTVWSLTTPRVTGKDQPLVTVYLNNGERLTCTTAHRFVMFDNSKLEAEDLQPGMELMTADWPVVASGTDHPEAYTQGFFAGDGWTTHKERKKQLHVISFKRQDKRLCIPKLLIRKSSELKSGYVYLYLSEDYAWDKNMVPNGSWSTRSRLDWLAGLLDSDGTAIWSYTTDGNKSSCSLTISSVNKTFIDKVSLLLRTLGVSTNRDMDTRQNDWSKSDVCYRIAIRSSMVKKLQAIGLTTHRLGIAKNNPLWQVKKKLLIERVEPAGRADKVYCFTEKEMHRGCFNGVLTSQCGEQPLPPFGACLLGSFNLVKYLKLKDFDGYEFNWEQFIADIPHVVRAMDNVVDRAIYPLFEQEKEAKSKRRIGLGVTSMANCFEVIGYPYGSEGFLDLEAQVLSTLATESYRASAMLAQEKGCFPLFDKAKYLKGAFIKNLPVDVQDLIEQHGIRNSHLTSIAPTGTISLCADNISSGIEPVFAYAFTREVIEFDNTRVEVVEDWAVRELGLKGKQSADVTIQEHLDVLAIASEYVDSAVSKTCNVPTGTSWEEFKQIYIIAWKTGCKGCTTFRIGGKRGSLLTIKEDDATNGDIVVASNPKEQPSTCYVDSTTGRHECE